jgi:hypothetical protein
LVFIVAVVTVLIARIVGERALRAIQDERDVVLARVAIIVVEILSTGRTVLADH